jgi:hypothetical protein
VSRRALSLVGLVRLVVWRADGSTLFVGVAG